MGLSLNCEDRKSNLLQCPGFTDLRGDPGFDADTDIIAAVAQLALQLEPSERSDASWTRKPIAGKTSDDREMFVQITEKPCAAVNTTSVSLALAYTDRRCSYLHANSLSPSSQIVRGMVHEPNPRASMSHLAVTGRLSFNSNWFRPHPKE